MKLSTVLEGIKAVASFGAGLIVAHECDKHDVPTAVTCTASCSTVAVTYKVLSVAEKYLVEADEREQCNDTVEYDDIVQEDLVVDEIVTEENNTDIEEPIIVQDSLVEETVVTEETADNIIETEAATTEEVGVDNKEKVNDKASHHQTKNVNDDMELAKQSLSPAEKKELEKEIMDKKQPSRPNRK